jgi:sugar phosphate permease
MLDEFGWSRGGTDSMFSHNILTYGSLAPVTGCFGDRWKPKKVMLIGLPLLCASATSWSFASELWHCNLLFGLVKRVEVGFLGRRTT